MFRLSDGRVIDYAMELAWVKERALACGMDPRRVATHGFRSGGVIDHMDDFGEGAEAVAFVKNQALWRGEMHQTYNGKRTPKLQGIRALKLAGIDIAELRRRTKFKKTAPKRPSFSLRRGGFFRRA